MTEIAVCISHITENFPQITQLGVFARFLNQFWALYTKNVFNLDLYNGKLRLVTNVKAITVKDYTKNNLRPTRVAPISILVSSVKKPIAENYAATPFLK